MNDIVRMVLFPCRVGMEQLKNSTEDPVKQESILELLMYGEILLSF